MGTAHGLSSITLDDGTTSIQLTALVGEETTARIKEALEQDETTPQDNSVHDGYRSVVEAVFLNVGSNVGQIRTWQEADTPVTLSASGERGIDWNEDTIPKVSAVELNGEEKGRSDAYRLTMRCRTARGETHDISYT